MSTTALVDLDSLRPRSTPSFLDTFRAYWEKRGVDGETAPLTQADLHKSPSQVLEETEERSRRFILCCSSTSLVLFVLTGMVVYGYGPVETWGPVKALYFTIATVTTVGFGDMTPSSQGSRLFTTFFNLIGVLIDALAVSELWSYIQHEHNRRMEQFNQAFARAISDRMNESDVLKPLARRAQRSSWFGFWSMLYRALMPVVVLNAIGVGLIGVLEHWTFVDILYYSTITCTTTGAGSLHPTRQSSYIIAIIYLPLAACTVARAVSVVTDYYLKLAEDARRAELLNRAYTWEGLFEMDANSDGGVGEYEFTVYFLKLWGMADEAIVAALAKRFKELDWNSSGRITRADFLNHRGPVAPPQNGSNPV